ncbi:hypothetical protein [Fictibacillus phosphorivorans]|nr:hypothetical protein [Fictibacillus phosphorivorans]
MKKVMDFFIALFSIGLLVLGLLFWDGLVEGFNKAYELLTSN